jgi:hypothetical protein
MLHTPLCMYRPLSHGYRRPFVRAASADHQPAHTHLRTVAAGGGSRLRAAAPTPVRTKHYGDVVGRLPSILTVIWGPTTCTFSLGNALSTLDTTCDTRMRLPTVVAAGGSQSWFELSSGINPSSTEPGILCCGHSAAHVEPSGIRFGALKRMLLDFDATYPAWHFNGSGAPTQPCYPPC